MRKETIKLLSVCALIMALAVAVISMTIVPSYGCVSKAGDRWTCLTVEDFPNAPKGATRENIDPPYAKFVKNELGEWVSTGSTVSGSGSVTIVTAGDGMTQTGSASINPTLNVVSHGGIAGSIGTINIGADAIGVNLGTTGTVAAAGDDYRFSDARPPTAHAHSHITGGSDVISDAIASGNSGLLTGADKAKIDGINSATLTMPIRNESGATIPAFRAVYISGYNNGATLIDLAAFNDPAKTEIVGVTNADIPTGSAGTIVTSGKTAWSSTTAPLAVGDSLYLWSNGTLAKLPPGPTGQVIGVARVTVSAISGEIDIKIADHYSYVSSRTNEDYVIGVSPPGGLFKVQDNGGHQSLIVSTGPGNEMIYTPGFIDVGVDLSVGGLIYAGGDITGANLSGTNTGNNAVNALYSGLVSNATHTGDATGSTALTVVKINGTQLSTLGTGLLLNTTGTGVPSIAIGSDLPTHSHAPTDVAGTAVVTADSRLSDARTPTAHASSHVTGGGDVIASVVAAGNAGLMTGTDKTKLDGIATGATANAGTVTSVTAGAGLTQSGTATVNPTLDVVSHAGAAGTIGTITVTADSVGVNLGATSTTAAAGNDSRLSDARPPTAHNQDATTITTGNLDGDRLPILSATKRGGVPATGAPSGKYLKDDDTWGTPTAAVSLDIQDEGGSLTTAPSVLNFAGAGVTVTEPTADSMLITIAGGGAPAGADKQVQFNNAGAAGVDPDFIYSTASKHLELGLSSGNLGAICYGIHTTDETPEPGELITYAKRISGRALPRWCSPSGVDSFYQAFLGRSKINVFKASGGSTTATGFGLTLTATGTATSATTSTVTDYAQLEKLEYLVTTAATTAVAGFRTAGANLWRGTLVGRGGFHVVIRFGMATGVTTSTRRLFVGVAGGIAAPSDVNPSTLTNIVGMGYDSGDTNMQIFANDGTGTATKTDLGADFVKPSADRTNMYELSLYCAPNSPTIDWEVLNLNYNSVQGGAVATGTISAAADLPTNTTFLGVRGYSSVGGTSSVTGLGLGSVYVEADN